MTYKRGAIRNVILYTQKKDYSELCYGTKTPTDQDGFLDFDGVLSIKIELKHKNAKLQFGQLLAFERDCDAINRGGVACYYLVAEHECAADQTIPVDRCRVVYCRHKKGWQEPDVDISVKVLIDRILEKHSIKVEPREMTAAEAIRLGKVPDYVMGRI